MDGACSLQTDIIGLNEALSPQHYEALPQVGLSVLHFPYADVGSKSYVSWYTAWVWAFGSLDETRPRIEHEYRSGSLQEQSGTIAVDDKGIIYTTLYVVDKPRVYSKPQQSWSTWLVWPQLHFQLLVQSEKWQHCGLVIYKSSEFNSEIHSI